MRRTISVFWIIVGVAAGLAGGLFYAWRVNPLVLTDTRPMQLSRTGQVNYLVALSLAYAQDKDLFRAVERLNEHLGKDWQELADTACELAQTGFASTNTGLTAIRSMVELAGTQGATGCASDFVFFASPTPNVAPATPTPTATFIPPPSKTPTPTLGPTYTPQIIDAPTIVPIPQGEFQIIETVPTCSADASGLIQVFVRDVDALGLAGVRVRVAWGSRDDAQSDDFFTGLKPEIDAGYADFSMEEGTAYTVELPGLSSRSDVLQATACEGSILTGYRITFRRAVNR